jgi:hypothetical protein
MKPLHRVEPRFNKQLGSREKKLSENPHPAPSPLSPKSEANASDVGGKLVRCGATLESAFLQLSSCTREPPTYRVPPPTFGIATKRYHLTLPLVSIGKNPDRKAHRRSLYPCDRSLLPHTPHSSMETIARRLPENDDTDDTDVVQPPPPLPLAAALAHYIRTASLVAASIALLPLSSYVLAFSYACNILIPQYGLRRKIRSAPLFQPKTILVTGVGTAKGLRIARAFYETGHKVIGADFHPLGIPSCGRFSKALSTYYPLRMPTASGGATLYMRDLVKIVEGEAVQLWVSCSELVCAVDDGQARELLEHRTSCKTVQVDVDTAGKISDNEFIRYARNIGLVYCMTLPSQNFADIAIAGPGSARSTIKSCHPSNTKRGEWKQKICHETSPQEQVLRRES